QANTATLWPSWRNCSISLPMSVLLPTPPLPVMASTRAGFEAGPSGIATPRAAKVMSRARLRRSFRFRPASNSSSMGRPAGLLQEFDYLRQRCTRTEHSGHAHFEQLRNVFFRDNAADENANISKIGFTQQLQ